MRRPTSSLRVVKETLPCHVTTRGSLPAFRCTAKLLFLLHIFASPRRPRRTHHLAVAVAVVAACESWDAGTGALHSLPPQTKVCPWHSLSSQPSLQPPATTTPSPRPISISRKAISRLLVIAAETTFARGGLDEWECVTVA